MTSSRPNSGTSPISERRGCRTATTNEVRTMFMRGLPAIAATVALLAAPASASAKGKYKICFQKDCPELTCTGTLLERSGAPRSPAAPSPPR